MPRQRAHSTASSRNSLRGAPPGQEMASMYDYLAKIILLGPSGSGKSCLLHRFVKNEWRVLSSQTIGVEFASKIVKVGTGGRRKRIKLQLWDTAGTERFRSVSRSYYRGAAGAVLVYDVADAGSFAQLPTFLSDARALASPLLSTVLVGNKVDLAEGVGGVMPNYLEDEPGSLPSTYSTSTLGATLGSQMRATMAPGGRAVPASVAAAWASQNRIPASMEVSALSGENVDEVFGKLASTILTKIELGEIDPDDSMSGIQYGDADYYRFDDGSSVKSGLTADGFGSTTRRRRKGKGGWGDVFRIGRPGSSGGGSGRCC
ncbi:putative ras family GTPase [Teratosphaeria nubilosa]|uniref:Putative ras family GTPase n=1 Tax=Teratosphaeria nubilosa TaxID=161662 RepID=A0A6G1L336_9PEZI|nr:putative ras family GTPase [Teratosphaeria nubilosa]